MKINDELNANKNINYNLKKSKYVIRNGIRYQKTVSSRKGGHEMHTIDIIKESLFENEIIGYRELRNNISAVIDSVTTRYNVVISGNIKKNNDKKTAAIISTNVLNDILKIYRFNTEVKKDDETGLYEAVQKEIRVYGSGETEIEALNQLVDMVIDSTTEYLENIDMYARMPDMKELYPYYLRISQCRDKEELLKVLSLS